MDTLNQDIVIRVRSEYQDLQNLQNKLEQLKSQFKSISKGRVDFGLKKMIRTSADPIREATKELEIAQKNLEKAQNKYRGAVVSGADPTKYKQNVADAKSRLMSVIKTIEHTKELSAIEERITAQYNEQKQYFDKMNSAQKALAQVMLSLDPARKKMAELQAEMNSLQEKFINLNMAGKDTKETENAIKKVYKQMQKLNESTKKTSNRVAVLWGRIKNIAIYRTIRRTLQIIFQTITKGFERVTELNKDAEQLALRLKADYNLLATAIGVTLYTVLKSFISQVDDLTDTLINYINAFNRGIAVVSGQDKYLKVVRKDIDAINNSVNNLSFDKFEALTKGNENTNGVGLVETVVGENPSQVEAEMEGLVKLLSGAFDAIKPILQSVLYVAGEILKIILKILKTGIIQFIVDLSAKIIEVVDNAGLLKALIVSLIALAIITKIKGVTTAIVAMTASMKALVAGVLIFLATFTFVDSLLDSFSGTAKMVVSAVLMIVGALVAVYTAIQLVKHAWTGFGAIALAVASGAVALAGLKGLVEVASEPPALAYANGGIPEKSELFYMNENGVPEALVNTGGTQTNVINIDQLSEGMRRGFTQAIYETGLMDAMQTRLVLDGNSVNDNAFARAIFPALKTESRRRGGNQL